MFLKSIRARFLLLLALLLAGVLTGFGVAMYQLQRASEFRQIDGELERRLVALKPTLRGPGGPHGNFGPGPRDKEPPFAGSRPFEFDPPKAPPDWDEPPRKHGGPHEAKPRGFGPDWLLPEWEASGEISKLFDETQTNGFYFVIWHRSGKLIQQTTNAPPRSLPGRSADILTHFETRAAFREAFHFTELGECILTGRFIGPDLAALHRLKWWLLGIGEIILLLGLAGGWWVVTQTLRPIQDISHTAAKIAGGDLTHRINTAATQNELGQLAAVLNSTFARLEAAFAKERQFTADAAHELRTPLAVLITEAQTALARERSATEYRETVEECLATAQQMRQLTESLLQLARVDAASAPSLEDCDLAALTQDCVARLRPLATTDQLDLQCDLSPCALRADPNQLRAVVTNLVANAIHYNQAGGQIRITTWTEGDQAMLIVADTGQGISSEDLPHIFERFYRADKARSRTNGHFGLGLAICKAIVEAHGGSIQASSTPGQGSQFRATLPTTPALQPER